MEKSFQTVISPHKFIPEITKDSRDFNTLWNTNKSWVLSNLSHLAYFKEDDIKTFMKKLGVTKTYFYGHAEAQAFLSIWDDKAVLSFRGTQPEEHPKKNRDKMSCFRKLMTKFLIKLPFNPFSLLLLSNDLLADFDFFQTKFKNTKVHSGFLKELNKVWKKDKGDDKNKILDDIEQHAKDIPIWVTGHSLGGAMATLAGMLYPFEAVTTFGEPRVGRRINRSFQSKEHTRYVNGDDPVTKLPPSWFSYYKHHGKKTCVTNLDGETNFIYDHSIIYYSENIL